MISARSWWLFVAVLGGGGAMLLAVVFRWVPTTADLADPLGRPATLTDSIVASSAGLNDVTTVLLPKQADLPRRIGVLTDVAGSLDEVVDQAGELTPLAGDANREIGRVIDVARPLPSLITQITGRAGEATDAAHDLGGTVTSLDSGLGKVGDRLVALHKSLDPLGPRADALAQLLARIELESRRIAPLSPLLRLIPRPPPPDDRPRHTEARGVTTMRLAWAIALAATIASVAGILILTSDQALSAAAFRAGVEQGQILDRTTDTALAAGLELPTANTALRISLPHVVQTSDSLIRARTTLATLGDQLVELGDVLEGADPPLRDIVTATRGTNTAAAAARPPVNRITDSLARADGSVQNLGTKLDRTLAHAHTIESKLRVLLLLPAGPR